uniref:Uncharacterized protein n=1 Tax=Siphoviridae sp. ctBLh2 TaxID=2827803 RepID=A0A8S5S3M3_9CAUD|nr:MAG TPA: hypothetical protein [Siphoviridae sp. ctBLh2]
MRLRHARQDGRKIEYELRRGVCNEYQIRIVALCDRIVEIDVEAELFHLCHGSLLVVFCKNRGFRPLRSPQEAFFFEIFSTSRIPRPKRPQPPPPKAGRTNKFGVARGLYYLCSLKHPKGEEHGI